MTVQIGVSKEACSE